MIYLTTSGSTDCLQTTQSQLTVIQVPHHGEFASLGQYVYPACVYSTYAHKLCAARPDSTGNFRFVVCRVKPKSAHAPLCTYVSCGTSSKKKTRPTRSPTRSVISGHHRNQPCHARRCSRQYADALLTLLRSFIKRDGSAHI